MIVVDASVLANALTDDGDWGAQARLELSRDVAWAAPAHLGVQVYSAIRRRWLGGKINERRAVDALIALSSAAIEQVDSTPLLVRMWDLRNNLTGYDAAYVALAETYACPLVTADSRLAKEATTSCEVRLAVPVENGP